MTPKTRWYAVRRNVLPKTVTSYARTFLSASVCMPTIKRPIEMGRHATSGMAVNLGCAARWREHRGRAVIHAEEAHGGRLHPEVENRLRPEPAVLRPPRRDPVVSREHLARDLAVVRFPRIGERVAAGHREIEEGGRQEDPEALPPPERAGFAGFVDSPRTERDAGLKNRHDERNEGARDEDAGRQRR